MHVCIYAYMHTCIHAYIHTDRQTYIHTYTHICIHTYIHCSFSILTPRGERIGGSGLYVVFAEQAGNHTGGKGGGS